MARVPYLDAADLDEADRPLLNRPINLFRALAGNPAGLREFQRIGEWIRYGGQLDPRLRELAILQVGYLTRSQYEYSHHVKIAQDFGVTADDINLICRPSDAPPADEGTAIVLTAATEITQDLELSDQTWQSVEALLGTARAIELVLVITHYCAVVRVLRTLKIDVEPDYQRYLKEFPLEAP
jgi:alkylhydroperoxidase family enzyme